MGPILTPTNYANYEACNWYESNSTKIQRDSPHIYAIQLDNGKG